MANAFHSPLRQSSGKRASTKKGGPFRFTEKPAFPTGVPGKTQPRDRSAGVKRAKIHPKAEGL